jgi:hypothetical protein
MFYIDPNLPAEEKAVLEAQLSLAKENAESHFKLHGRHWCYAPAPQFGDASKDVSQSELDHSKS